MNDITIFDKIISGAIPCDKVFENEHVLAFHDISSQAPVHVLVIPKKKIARIENILSVNEEDLGFFWKGIASTAKQLDLDENGYRVVINNGKDAMQTVEYLHAHILGGRSLKWPPG